MHENGNLKDKIGIQVGQIKRIVIEKTVKVGETGKPRPRIKKGTKTMTRGCTQWA